jgi:hypothetical protein
VVRSLARAIGDGVAARKLGQLSSDSFVDGRGNDTSLRLSIAEEVENRAVGDETRVVVTGVGCLLKGGDIPAVDEIAVESVASRITLSENERLVGTVPPIEAGSGVDDLEEDGDQVDRVRCRARAVVVRVLGRVGHVGLVVRRVQVYAIPARREEDLGAQTIGADLVRKATGVSRGATVIKTDKADSLASEVVGLCTLEGVTGKHTEAFRESGEVVVVGTASLEVVNSHTTVDTLAVTSLGNINECAVLRLVVELGGPVVGHVLLDRARRACTATGISICHLSLESLHNVLDSVHRVV